MVEYDTPVGLVPLLGHGNRMRGHAVVDWMFHEALLAMGRWSMDGSGYARLSVPNNPELRGGMMHRLLLALTKSDPWVVDHANRDRLDNRLENLRLATRAENAQNRDPSKPRGVGRRSDGRFRARVIVNGVEHGKNFKDYDEAQAWAAEKRADLMPFSAEAMERGI